MIDDQTTVRNKHNVLLVMCVIVVIVFLDQLIEHVHHFHQHIFHSQVIYQTDVLNEHIKMHQIRRLNGNGLVYERMVDQILRVRLPKSFVEMAHEIVFKEKNVTLQIHELYSVLHRVHVNHDM